MIQQQLRLTGFEAAAKEHLALFFHRAFIQLCNQRGWEIPAAVVKGPVYVLSYEPMPEHSVARVTLGIEDTWGVSLIIDSHGRTLSFGTSVPVPVCAFGMALDTKYETEVSCDHFVDFVNVSVVARHTQGMDRDTIYVPRCCVPGLIEQLQLELKR